mmetsp:Transcript_60309/g.187166  ORF Transcript_60309/g.187166 Transcript_60309/m.187166 type:complete len:180 (+) Transcript_60309:80-619(+)
MPRGLCAAALLMLAPLALASRRSVHQAGQEALAAAPGDGDETGAMQNISNTSEVQASLVQQSGKADPSTILRLLGENQQSLELLAKGICPYKLGSSEEETQGVGCKLGCACAKSWLKTCWKGECSAGDAAMVAMGKRPSSACVAVALGECRVATWVYAAGITSAILAAAIPAGLFVMKK